MESEERSGPIIALSGHAILRIEQRTKLKPSDVRERIARGLYSEIERNDPRSRHVVIWDDVGKEPILVIMTKHSEQSWMIRTCYPTANYHMKMKRNFIVMPAHIDEARSKFAKHRKAIARNAALEKEAAQRALYGRKLQVSVITIKRGEKGVERVVDKLATIYEVEYRERFKDLRAYLEWYLSQEGVADIPLPVSSRVQVVIYPKSKGVDQEIDSLMLQEALW